jgi:hypothetical protein
MHGLALPGVMMTRVLSTRLESSPPSHVFECLSRRRVLTHHRAFDPPGLGSTSCDRITSSKVCHIEKHIKPHEKKADASLLGTCVKDNYGEEDEDECSDGCCCFTENVGRSEEECRPYQLDNYTLTALVESGDEEYQHFQNATGHWVRRLVKVCPALAAVLVGPHPGLHRAPEASPRRYRGSLEMAGTLWPRVSISQTPLSVPLTLQEKRDNW